VSVSELGGKKCKHPSAVAALNAEEEARYSGSFLKLRRRKEIQCGAGMRIRRGSRNEVKFD